MNWKEVETVATNGNLTVIDWRSLKDGLWEDKDKECAKFKIYHKSNMGALHFEFGIINDKRAYKVKKYLEDNGLVNEEIKARGNTLAKINGIKFRIGYGPVAPYLVFKPETQISLRLDELDKGMFIKEFETFKKSVTSSGLDTIIAKIK